ncbi:lysophospholipid acyltransferase family protein [Limibaculum sp. M0105]|uniref:Lysophospholipid acyltransferase family protein n=1 Tax=Thermohalobaculum xanthum TaxID=2753746 RepID=A0A8J7M5S2_9RHOB|nr:lysophospholipid acyltransferase family protein [Thermohalobaculum xanthum]MBK0398974.1 lysophospholipid acyltransferase family protein [Thermohalobaculum xanthum]
MQSTGAAPREISYSFAARSQVGRAVIRSIENITGRPRLLRMALGYETEVEAGRDFWEVMRERYGIRIEATGMENIPREGPLVAVANHPYGILDGLALGNILSAARGDFRIIAHVVFRRAKDLQRVILPIDFGETKEAQRVNIETRKTALDYLASGGAIGIFPGGTVSTSAKPFSRPLDPHWKTFTAKMIAKSEAAVVPIYFEGQNSRLFQIASHLNPTLRVALLINEFDSRVGEPLRVHIGTPLPQAEIAARRRDSRALMEYLRRETYALDPSPKKDFSHGLYLG